MTAGEPPPEPPMPAAARAHPRTPPPSPAQVVGTPRPAGHGQRLTAAFEALEVFPALAESRNRVLALVAEDRPGTGEVVAAIESDVALVIAVLRLGNQLEGARHGRVESIVEAVEVLSPEAVQRLAVRRRDLRVLRARQDVGRGARALPPARRRRPARRRPARRAGQLPDRDRLLVTALLHDIGKLVLMHAYPGYPRQVHGPARTPEERLHYERRELGVDHALVGGVLARRWNLPARRRVRDRAPPRRGRRGRCRLRPPGRHGRPLRPGRRRSTRTSCCAPRGCVGFGPSELRTVLYDLPVPDVPAPARDRAVPAVGPRGRGAQAPRAGDGLQADRPELSLSTSARCARTCTTSTASSAPSIALRRSSSPPSAAGCRDFLRRVSGGWHLGHPMDASSANRWASATETHSPPRTVTSPFCAPTPRGRHLEGQHQKGFTPALHRIHTGVFALGHVAPGRLGDWHAAVLACGEGTVLSRRSGSTLWRVREGEHPRIDVTNASGAGRDRPGIEVHRAALLPVEMTTHHNSL